MLLHDVTAVLREALTNVVKHARCSAVYVRVAVTAEAVTVEVTDDGPATRGRDRRPRRGSTGSTGSTDRRRPTPTDGAGRTTRPLERRHRGLANLTSRAHDRGGDCTLTTDERETVLTWTALLSP